VAGRISSVAQIAAAALIDPEISLVDRYLALTAREGLRIHYLIDTHTHADHFSATHNSRIASTRLSRCIVQPAPSSISRRRR
jgi:glyoxylase-like metal-dependent hydrolase (beta-lactamase superfamily II)